MAFILDMSQKQISIDSRKDGGSVRWTVAVPFDMPKSHLRTLRDVFTSSTAELRENDFSIPGGLLKAIIEDELADSIEGILPVGVKSRDEYGQDNGPFETYYGNGNLWQSLVFKDDTPVSGSYYTIDGQLDNTFITDADGNPMTIGDKNQPYFLSPSP